MSKHLTISKLIMVVFVCALAGVALVGCSSTDNNDNAKEEATEQATSDTESQSESKDGDKAKVTDSEETDSSQVASSLTLKTSTGEVTVNSKSTYDDFKTFVNEYDEVIAETVNQANKVKAPSNDLTKNVVVYAEARVPISTQLHQVATLETITSSAHKAGSITDDEYLKLDRKLDYYAEQLDEALEDLRLRMGLEDY